MIGSYPTRNLEEAGAGRRDAHAYVPEAGAGTVAVQIVYETHSTSEDNDLGLATGWLDGRLSAEGRLQAAALGGRRGSDGLACVFSSDLGRARETVEIAFGGSPFPILFDWRLRECDYGSLNGGPTSEVHADRLAHLDEPYPDGESWRQAVARVGPCLDDVRLRYEGRRVLVVGHAATRWGLEHVLNGIALERLLVEAFEWQEGWEYRID
jgi:2,3-bisphosphoglycerate-dependent phosphoglycerate mutase